MYPIINNSLKEWIPPIILKTYGYLINNQKYGFFGDYQSWEEAKQHSIGYDSDLILQRVKESLCKVKEGTAVYERDSVIFNEIHYSYPVLAALLRVAIEDQGELSVLDFGGSLGSTYFQCKDFLSPVKRLKWNIVEQENFVNCGKLFFEDECLSFFYDIESCLQKENSKVILLSGVVQCLENPYLFLEKLINYNFEYIIFDRTAFLKGDKDRLTIQKVPPNIYPASYPAWFLNLERFLSIFMDKYKLILDFNSSDYVNIPSEYKGFLFQRI
jgi:putative methyltransferase (TIGR04325 family)